MITPKLHKWSDTIKGYYREYNHIILVPYPSEAARLWNQAARLWNQGVDGFSFRPQIYTWANEHLKGTMTIDVHRVLKMTDGAPKEWHFNEFGSDEMFAAFEYEEDATMFLLRWL